MGLWDKIKKAFTGIEEEKKKKPEKEEIQTEKPVLKEKTEKSGYIDKVLQGKAEFNPEKVIHETRALLRKGEEAKAIQLLYLILNKYPGQPDIQFFLCSVLIDRGDFDEALPLLRGLIDSGYTRRDIIEYWLGFIYEEKGELKEACIHYERALGHNINYMPAKIRYEKIKQLINAGKKTVGKESLKESILKKERQGEDRFEILEEIGGGGAGVIYRVKDRLLNRDVAMKVYHGGISKNQFFKEASVPSLIPHPGVVKIYSIDSEHSTIFMKYYPGGSLKQKLKEKWSEEKVIEFIIKICEPLIIMEKKKIIHRDLKPENILFDDNEYPVIIDFGLAFIQEEDKKGDIILGGTERYMPPEYKDGAMLNNRYDHYSLGIIIKELVTSSGISSPYIDEVISRCCNSDYTLRPSFKEIKDICEAALLRIRYSGQHN